MADDEHMWSALGDAENVVRLPAAAGMRDGVSGKPKSKKRVRSVKKEAEAEVLLLGEAKRDVYELGSTAFDKRAKKVFDSEKIIAFGGKAPKNPKMPLKMLLGIRQAEQKRADREAAERRESGQIVAHQKLDNVLRPLGKKSSKKRRRRDDSFPIDDLRDGVLRLKNVTKTKPLPSSFHSKKKGKRK